jgi:ATP-dependent RNA helicase MSS116
MLSALRRCSASIPRSLVVASSTTSSARAAASRTSVFTAKCFRPVALRTLHQSVKWQQYQNATAERQVDEEDDHTPTPPSGEELITKFADLETKGLIDRNVIQAITRNMGLETMTEVQSATINEALKGNDV